jgi:hypothetical protein
VTSIIRRTAVAVAAASAALAIAVPVAAAVTPSAPVILVTGWPQAVRLMHGGDWSTRAQPGVFYSTAVPPRQVPVVVFLRFVGMAWAVRHGYECTAAPRRAWQCTPDQIP